MSVSPYLLQTARQAIRFTMVNWVVLYSGFTAGLFTHEAAMSLYLLLGQRLEAHMVKLAPVRSRRPKWKQCSFELLAGGKHPWNVLFVHRNCNPDRHLNSRLSLLQQKLVRGGHSQWITSESNPFVGESHNSSARICYATIGTQQSPRQANVQPSWKSFGVDPRNDA